MPVTDPRFLDATVDDMMVDFYSHLFTDDPKAAEEIEDEDFNADDVAELINYKPTKSDDDEWETL